MPRSLLTGSGLRAAAPRLGRPVALAVLAGALLAILGPFGSYLNGGAGRLLAYWIGAVLLGLALYGTAFVLVDRRLARGSARWWAALAAATLLASVPEALATRAAALRLWPALAALDLPFAGWYAQTLALGLAAMAAVAALSRRPAPAARAEAAPRAPVAAAALGGDVLALQMEDHYVRVHRPGGSELVLMPLGRAIDAVGTEGLRTHRSWWVAAHAVAAVEGDARAMRLRLTNGAVAPVARSAVIHLRAAGWLVPAPDAPDRTGGHAAA